MAAVAPCIARLQGRRRWTAADIWSNCLASGETPSCRARWRHEFLSQLRHQRVQYYASTQEIRGAIERDMTVFGTITSGMTTGVCEVGDSLLHHVIGYFQSLLTQSFVPFMVAPIAKCLLEEINARGVFGGPGNVYQGREYTWRLEHSVCRCVVSSIFLYMS